MCVAMRRHQCRKATNPPVAMKKAKNDAEEKEKESVCAKFSDSKGSMENFTISSSMHGTSNTSRLARQQGDRRLVLLESLLLFFWI